MYTLVPINSYFGRQSRPVTVARQSIWGLASLVGLVIISIPRFCTPSILHWTSSCVSIYFASVITQQTHWVLLTYQQHCLVPFLCIIYAFVTSTTKQPSIHKVDSCTTNNTELGEILEKLEPIDSESLKKCNLENRWGRNWTPWTTNKLFTGDSDIYWFEPKMRIFQQAILIISRTIAIAKCKNISDSFCTGRYPGCYCPEVMLYPLDHPFDCSRSIPA